MKKLKFLNEYKENEALYNQLTVIADSLNNFIGDFGSYTPPKELIKVFMNHEDLDKLQQAAEILDKMQLSAYNYAKSKGQQYLKAC